MMTASFLSLPARLLFACVATLALQASAADAPATVARIKLLSPPKDPLRETVLIGRGVSDGLTTTLEIEGAEAMWMQTGTPPMWSEHVPASGERFHIEVKTTDNKTRTRLPYSIVNFSATNHDSGKVVAMALPPMWGGSGLHYSENCALSGDGTYAATVTVGVPSFAREMKDMGLWAKPVVFHFHFKLKDGLLTEVSAPAAATN